MASQIIQLDIQSDVDRMVKSLTRDQKVKVPKALNGTINKVATTVRAKK